MFSRFQDYRVLESIAECYRVLQSVTEYCRVLQRVTEYYRVLQNVTECYKVVKGVTECYRVLQSVTEYCRVLQSTTECYRVLQSISSASTWTNFWACFFYLLFSKKNQPEMICSLVRSFSVPLIFKYQKVSIPFVKFFLEKSS